MCHILTGDIGGTKTLLRITAENGASVPLFQKSYPSVKYGNLAEILEEFLHEARVTDISAACLALPGPVSGRRVKLTNLPWEVDADKIALQFGIGRISLMNDFEAVGFGIGTLSATDLLTIQPGESRTKGVRMVAGAGTGLGVTWLTWQDDGYAVHASEGGHMDFAPADDMQYELLRYLQKRYSHVSYERIVSGPGLIAIFDFLRDKGHAIPSSRLLAAMRDGDPAEAISHFCRQIDEPVARMTMNLFMQIYGAFVGNLALALMPRGGIYIAGGIVAKNIQAMQQGTFMHGFRNKGRYTELLGTFPVHVVKNTQVGLQGAGLAAFRLIP
uniref:Glucokinase n=1 Tax=Candidatus Nitrotoga fabula TaxID=2182327 RepID=A0A2X0QSL4_9PROT|nr:Glucokinase [Candidatus Nitrotoga fabula]